MEKACSMLRNDDKVRKERVSIYSMSLFEIVEKTSQITLLIITLRQRSHRKIYRRE